MALIVVFAMSVACAPLQPPQQQRINHSDVWREWTTPHFTFDSDLPASEANAFAADCERSLQAFDVVVAPLLPGRRPSLRVVLFVREEDFRALGPTDSHGLFVRTAADGEIASTIYLGGGTSWARALTSFQHELTHLYVAYAAPQAPTWLNEGLAELFRSMRIGDDGVWVGAPPPSDSPAYIDITRLTATTGDDFLAPVIGRANYRRASALVHFLWFAKHDQLLQFLKALTSGMAPEPAWHQSFQEPPAQLQARFDSWYKIWRADGERRRFAPDHFQSPPRTVLPPSQPRLLTPSQLRVLEAQLLDRRGDPVAAYERARQAVNLDPKDPEAYYWAGVLAGWDPSNTAARYFEASLTLRPDDERALAGLLSIRLANRTRRDDFSSVQPLAERIRRDTSLVMPLRALAELARARGDGDDAVALLQRALEISPACTSCRFTLAGQYNVMGRTDDANRELLRATALTFELSSDRLRSVAADFAAVAAALPHCHAGGAKSGDDDASCVRLGRAFISGSGAPYDWSTGVTLLERSCAPASDECLPVATALRYGAGLPADAPRAANILERACAANQWLACNQLGDQYQHGDGAPRDSSRAEQLYRQACDHEEWLGCVSLAELAWLGQGQAHNEKLALEFLRRAASKHPALQASLRRDCLSISSAACALASLAASAGVGGRVDGAAATRLRTFACEQGDSLSCGKP
jgi:TPR repeat protein/Flp pilus assembly protein TadD